MFGSTVVGIFNYETNLSIVHVARPLHLNRGNPGHSTDMDKALVNVTVEELVNIWDYTNPYYCLDHSNTSFNVARFSIQILLLPISQSIEQRNSTDNQSILGDKSAPNAGSLQEKTNWAFNIYPNPFVSFGKQTGKDKQVLYDQYEHVCLRAKLACYVFSCNNRVNSNHTFHHREQFSPRSIHFLNDTHPDALHCMIVPFFHEIISCVFVEAAQALSGCVVCVFNNQVLQQIKTF